MTRNKIDKLIREPENTTEDEQYNSYRLSRNINIISL